MGSVDDGAAYSVIITTMITSTKRDSHRYAHIHTYVRASTSALVYLHKSTHTELSADAHKKRKVRQTKQ